MYTALYTCNMYLLYLYNDHLLGWDVDGVRVERLLVLDDQGALQAVPSLTIQ